MLEVGLGGGDEAVRRRTLDGSNLGVYYVTFKVDFWLDMPDGPRGGFPAAVRFLVGSDQIDDRLRRVLVGNHHVTESLVESVLEGDYISEFGLVASVPEFDYRDFPERIGKRPGRITRIDGLYRDPTGVSGLDIFGVFGGGGIDLVLVKEVSGVESEALTTIGSDPPFDGSVDDTGIVRVVGSPNVLGRLIVDPGTHLIIRPDDDVAAGFDQPAVVGVVLELLHLVFEESIPDVVIEWFVGVASLGTEPDTLYVEPLFHGFDNDTHPVGSEPVELFAKGCNELFGGEVEFLDAFVVVPEVVEFFLGVGQLTSILGNHLDESFVV